MWLGRKHLVTIARKFYASKVVCKSKVKVQFSLRKKSFKSGMSTKLISMNYVNVCLYLCLFVIYPRKEQGEV